MEQPARRRLTLQEYLDLEAVSSERLEYRDGYAAALATPTGNHGRIATNLLVSLAPLVRTRGCDLFAGDAKVITPNGNHLIPDLVVTCDPKDKAVLDGSGEAIIRHPWLVVEILSPSTAEDDMSQKLDSYRSIPELSHYVLVDSRRRSIRLYTRIEDGSFASRGPLEELSLPSLVERGLSSEDVYRDTSVPRLEDIRSPRV